MPLRRKTANVRVARANQMDARGHGRSTDWYSRMPDDATYWQRAQKMVDDGVDSRVSYWQAGQYYGLQVQPIAPDRFPSDFPEWGGKYRVTLGTYWDLTPEQRADVRRLQARFQQPQRMRLRFDQLNDKGHAPLAANDPLRTDPLIQRLHTSGRNLHVTT